MREDEITFHKSVFINSSEPKEYKEYALKTLRHQVGISIFDILFSQKLPAVMDIEESVYKVPWSSEADYTEEVRINVRITPVQYRDVVIAKAPELWIEDIQQNNICMKIRNFWNDLRKRLGI